MEPLDDFCKKIGLELTVRTASLAARARISAHETVSGQNLSTSSFIASMTSNPRTEFRFGNAFFSPLKSSVSSRRREASQPYAMRKIIDTAKSYNSNYYFFF